MILSIHPEHPEPRKIKQAVDALRAGEVIAYPTDTVYGLGCDLMNKKAIDKLYSIKRAAKNHNLSFVCADLSDIAKYAQVDNAQYRLLKHHLPGAYCFILEATREVPKLMQSKKRTVGIRVPDHAVPAALVRELGSPLISTTAQLEGDEQPFIDPHELARAFPGLAIVLDGGVGGMVPSTVVDLSAGAPQVLREGAGDTAAFL